MLNPRYRPIILVTGASSGVGRALAELFSGLPQYRTVVTARRFSLAKLRKRFKETDNFRVEELDITDPNSRARCLQNIRNTWGEIDILINNAGISYRSVVEHMSEADEFLQMDTNYFGPLALIREVVASMRKIGRGKIINISSVSGMLAMPTMASYSASKHALEGASEALWYEMKPFGINVSLIQPGFINSHSFKNVYFSQKSNPENLNKNSAYSDYYEHMGPFIARLMQTTWSTPYTVAQKVLQVIQTENPPLWVPATSDAILFGLLRRLIPRRWLMPLLFRFLPQSKVWGIRHTLRRDVGHRRHRDRLKQSA